MKKSKNKIIFIAIILLLAIGLVVSFIIYSNSNQLTIKEKSFVNKKSAEQSLINIGLMQTSVFAKDGSGVLYDLLNDFSQKYQLNLNKANLSIGDTCTDTCFAIKTTLSESDYVIYKDHFVLISKEFKNIIDLDEIKNEPIGILSSDLSYVSSFLKNYTLTYNSYDNNDELLSSLDKNKYLIVPLHMFMEEILANDYYVDYHFSDIVLNIVLEPKGDIGNILLKYYKYREDDIQNLYNQSLFKVMTKNLKINESDIASMQGVTYNYGFINNSPYEVIASGNYGGIVSVYLSDFKDMMDLDIKFKKYKNLNKFNKALAKNEIDLYFGYYDAGSEFKKTQSGIPVKYSVVANKKNEIVINSINALVGKEVYVDKNSYLYTYLKTINGINIKTYNNSKDLVKLNNKNVLILIDNNIFEYYQNHGLNNYTSRYVNDINYMYGFNIKNDGALFKLLNRYVNITDYNIVLNEGLYNHDKIMHSGIILTYIAKYFIYLLLFIVILAYFFVRKTKKIKIAKKIKKDDKMRFIDQLTMLKNRNYLKENISSWSNNTIYPQALIIVDLNNLRKINDIEGYDEGDKQIKAAANSLMKTQLDNSDIIRTDGNEFAIYLIGYSQKQITNYIHKLNKEFNKLPYNYGAEFGYSMILDDIKTIEDALNEATTMLKKNKEVHEKEN